ncbi:MAG: hypothetical protein WC807_00540 [Hyphomicrobium sp.]|jgi:hypothetical protein
MTVRSNAVAQNREEQPDYANTRTEGTSTPFLYAARTGMAPASASI